MGEPAPLHIMVLPFNAQGHINPMLSFSALLTYRGCIVTFITSHKSHYNMVEAYEPSSSTTTSPFDLPNMRFVCIPDVPGISEIKPDLGTLKLMLEGAAQQQGLVEEIIRNSSPPITCIVADSFFQWTQDLASKLGISRVMFWASNSASLYLSCFLSSPGKAYPSYLPLKEDEVFFYISDSDAEEKRRFSIERFERIDEAACILVNSVRELDSSFLEAVDLTPPIRCVGPCLTLEEGADEQVLVSSVRASLQKEEVECLKWLDKQAKCSVVYIAFGSIVRLSDAQVEEVAAGLEASGEPFLWVTRAGVVGAQESSNEDIAITHGSAGEEDDITGNNIPSSSAQYAGLKLSQSFLEHTRDRGLIISWAPQLRVLGHPAISCFFTHCGWNSVMDSLSMNVPMLCLPFFGDQFINEQLIVKVWQVGFGFERRTKLYQHVLSSADGATQNKHHNNERATSEMDTLVKQQEIEAVLRKLLHSVDGTNARVRVSNLRAAIHRAMKEGGSSRLDLEMFVEDMINNRGSSSIAPS